MEVVTIESKIYLEFKEKFELLFKLLTQQDNKSLSGENEDDMWVDTEAVCKYLKISRRTLQRLKAVNKIPYSVLSGKSYYSIADIKGVLMSSRKSSIEEQINDLKASHSNRYQSLRKSALSINKKSES